MSASSEASIPAMTRDLVETGDIPPTTRQLLLEHAAAVFAERGFHDATVRDICGRAGASLCLVNYHYRDKLGLYRAVLRHLAQLADLTYPLQSTSCPSPDPAERLREFIQAYMLRVFDDGIASWYGRIMAREMVQPSGILDEVTENDFRPRWALLRSILAELLDRPSDDMVVARVALSVYGQIFIYHNCRPVLQRFGHPMPTTRESIEQLTDYITRFTLGAIESLKRASPDEFIHRSP